MFVPVTTKPFLNSVNFSLLQRVSLHYFSLIKEKNNQHFTSCENGNHGHEDQKFWSSCPLSYVFYTQDNSTYKYYCTAFVIFEFRSFDLQASVADDLQDMHSFSEAWVSLKLEFYK